MSVVFFKAYIHTFKLFPSNTLKVNSNIALALRSKIFDLSRPADECESVEADVVLLEEALKLDEATNKAISRAFLVEAFYYSCGVTTEVFKEKSESLIEKAKCYDAAVIPIEYDSFGPFFKEVKTDVKMLKGEIKRLSADRIEKEKLKQIKPLTISSGHILFAISLFSTLFLVSGVIYTKLIFGNLGVSVSDFF
ncbi:MAG: hypothetical protein KUG82_06540 [Pseudomonadales bacterium]|nr:hypothetical protein [Pseudomonadales bacterium]